MPIQRHFRPKSFKYLHLLNFQIILLPQICRKKKNSSSCVFRERKYSSDQCCGSGSESGSTGSTCFWASWIRIRIHSSEVWIRILLSLCKNSKKTIDFYCFVTSFDFFSLKNDVNVPSKGTVICRKTLF
jgi:hypothetical protein